MAALAGSDIMDPTGNTPPAPTETEERPSKLRHGPADPIVDVARRYALAARTWTPETYRSSWEWQIELAPGSYRRALIAKRPGHRELVAEQARVLRAERDPRIRPPNARVLVTLDERTTAGGQTIRGRTVNEVRLRRHGERWLVIGWTVVPAERAEPPFVLFICQDDAQRDDFLVRADQELTGHHWHPTHTANRHKYIGRRHILFCDERDAHLGHCQARRLPPYPPGHSARHGHDAEVRGVRLPGPLNEATPRPTVSDSSLHQPVAARIPADAA